MGSTAIRSYEKGGVVKKPDPKDVGVYTAEARVKQSKEK
jgi:hypothetical protein